MHWSTSVVQLGAIGLMTVLRTMVCRHLAQNPKTLPLVSGHELDWLALGGKPEDAPWLHPPGDCDEWSKHHRPWAETKTGECDGWDWKVAAIEDPRKLKPLHPFEEDAHESGEETQEAEHGVQETRPSSSNQQNVHNRQSTAHNVMRIRRDLGKLADWHGPASAEAIAIARAIEVTMDALFAEPHSKRILTWSLPALTSSRESSPGPVNFHVTREDGGN
jgi:hypothetical protein